MKELQSHVGDPAEIARLHAQIAEHLRESWARAIMFDKERTRREQAEAQIAALRSALLELIEIGEEDWKPTRPCLQSAREVLAASLPAASVSQTDDDLTRGDGVPGVGLGDLPRRNDGDK